ncbi:hypothetical protein C3L33_07451, partial [Rhododendron williamsianum]
MTTGIIHDQNLEKHIEKQMGCMAGFFQIFDRHHLLTGKRLNSTKRLPPPPAGDSTPEMPREAEKPQQTRPMTSPSPDRLEFSPPTDYRSPADIPATFPLPLPLFECKDGVKSSWKFSKEAPRLSLDSRASVDGKGKIRINPAVLNNVVATADGCGGDDKRRSPSVIAKLMGLDQLPNNSTPHEPIHNAELRRSASESRVSRDYRFTEGSNNNFHMKQQNQFHSRDNAARENTAAAAAALNGRPPDPMSSEQTKPLYRGVWKSSHQQHRKSFFDSADFFPEPKQTVCVYGDVEKRLKMRGIDEASKDLETLKQILEAMQLKGLLHSKKVSEQQISQRNIVYDRSCFNSDDQSPIVIMRPSRSPAPYKSFPNNSPNRAGASRNPNNSGDNLPPSMSPRRERQSVDARSRNSSSPTRRESNNARSPCSSPARRRALSSVETQRKGNEPAEQRRAPPVHSPRPSPKRNRSDQAVITARLPRTTGDRRTRLRRRRRRSRLKMGERRGGRSLLERCDKLVNSILEMTATELQPSPVSVLDSSFYKDEEEESSPSPVLKRTIDFKDQSGEFEEEIWSPAISPLRSKHEDESEEDCDFVYISDILRAFSYLPDDSDVFLLLEKQQYFKGKDTSKASRLQRRLIFDTITEILNRNIQLPPWIRIRGRDTAAEDLFDVICGVLRKDLAGDGVSGWGDCPVEMSETVLDIERLIFKDLSAKRSEISLFVQGIAGSR